MKRRTFLGGLLGLAAAPVIAKIPLKTPVPEDMKGGFLTRGVKLKSEDTLNINGTKPEYSYRYVQRGSINRFYREGWRIVNNGAIDAGPNSIYLMRYPA